MENVLFEIGESTVLERLDRLNQDGIISDYAYSECLAKHIRGDYGIIATQVKKENEEALNSTDKVGKTIYSLYEVGEFDIGISTELGETDDENITRLMTVHDMDRIFRMLDKRLVDDEHMRNTEAVEHFAKKEMKAAPVESASKKKIGRNDPCYCGSGKKYKKCCLGKEDNQVPKFDDAMASNFNHLMVKPLDLEKNVLPPFEDFPKEMIELQGFNSVEEMKLAIQLAAIMSRNAYIEFLQVQNHGMNIDLESLLEYAQKLGYKELEELAMNWTVEDEKRIFDLNRTLVETNEDFQALLALHQTNMIYEIDCLMINEFNEIMNDSSFVKTIEKGLKSKVFFSAAIQHMSILSKGEQLGTGKTDMRTKKTTYNYERLQEVCLEAGFNELLFLVINDDKSIFESNTSFVHSFLSKQSRSIQDKINRLGPIYNQILAIKLGFQG